jgi:hypothetical protein
MSPTEGHKSLVFDSFNLDLFIKVASHTIFSPFFTFFVPIIYKGVGYQWTEPLVAWSGAWWMFMVAICKLLWIISQYGTVSDVIVCVKGLWDLLATNG